MHKLFIILHSIILRCFLRDRYSQRLHFVAKHCSLNIVYDYTAYTHECTVSFLTQRYIYMPSQQWQKMRMYFVAAVVIGYRNYCIVLLLLLLFFCTLYVKRVCVAARTVQQTLSYGISPLRISISMKVSYCYLVRL